jgi:GTP-binding protein EngB required for normal cell division
MSMVGLTNVGKSTLAEALLEYPVAPRRNGPATAVPVEYEYADGPWVIQTIDQRNLTVMELKFDSVPDLTRALEKKVLTPESDDLACDSRERIVVKGPIRLLRGGLVFADTPGFGSAQLDNSCGASERALVDYLNKHVHEVMFCVSASNGMVTKAERNFFESISHLCSTVIMTKWDSEPDRNESDKKLYEGKFSELFPMCPFLYVNAKEAIKDAAQGDLENQTHSKVEEVHTLFQNRSGKRERQQLLKCEIERACRDLSLLLKPLRPSLSSIPWDQAILANFFYESQKENLTITPFE